MLKTVTHILAFSCVFLFSQPTTASPPFRSTNTGIYHNAYSKTVNRWKSALKKHNVSGSTWVGPVFGNGFVDKKHKARRRDTIIFVPTSTRFDEKPTVILFFHGLGGFGKRDFEIRLVPNIKELIAQNRNFIIVIPEMPWSTNTSTKRKRQGYVWSGTKHENFSTFFMSAKQVVAGLLYPDAAVREVCLGIGLCDPNFGEVVIVGHSAGGSAIRMAARTQGLNSARPTKIIFSDAGYGTWTDQAWHHYVSKNSDCRLILLVRKWDKPYQNTMRFLKRFRQRIPKNIELYVFDRRKYYHSDIGDQSLKWVFTLQNQSL